MDTGAADQRIRTRQARDTSGVIFVDMRLNFKSSKKIENLFCQNWLLNLKITKTSNVEKILFFKKIKKNQTTENATEF